jgi:transposase
MRYEFSDYEWTAIKPMLPNKPRGVRRVNDRRMLNGIFWVLRSGAPWRDLPENYPHLATCSPLLPSAAMPRCAAAGAGGGAEIVGFAG